MFVSGWFSDQQVCRQGSVECIGRAAYVPWLLQITSIFWLISLWDAVYYQEKRRRLDEIIREEEFEGQEKRNVATQWPRNVLMFLKRKKLGQERKDEERGDLTQPNNVKVEKRKGKKIRVGLWDLSASEVEGPFGWSCCLRRPFLLSLYFVMFAAILVTSYGAIIVTNYTLAFLNVTGLVLFAFGVVGGNNNYVNAPHRHRGDNLRIPLHTNHKSGTVYILPSKSYGLEAVWTPKIKNEYEECDTATQEMIEKLLARNGEYRVPETTLRSIVGPFVEKTILSDAEVIELAKWLYRKGADSEMQNLGRCDRPKGIHLIGSGLAFALMHAEYLVFRNSWRLGKDLKDEIFTLRDSKKSGLTENGSEKPMIGSGRNGSGYKDVVEYVYSLFAEKIDEEAINLKGNVPLESAMFKWDDKDPGKSKPATINEYRNLLWQRCIDDAESTFAALFIFTQVWICDVGHVGGIHSIPLRAKSKQGDLTAWKVVWRQGWYQAVGAQIIVMIPVVLSAFIAGILG